MPKERGPRPQNPMMERWKGGEKTGPAYKRARKQEAETAGRLRAKLIPASGSRFRKTDAEIPDLARIECKATAADSFRVTKDMFATVENAALGNGQIPYIEIEFVDNKGKPTASMCVLKRIDLERLLTRVQDAEGIAPTDRRSVRLAKQFNGRLKPGG